MLLLPMGFYGASREFWLVSQRVTYVSRSYVQFAMGFCGPVEYGSEYFVEQDSVLAPKCLTLFERVKAASSASCAANGAAIWNKALLSSSKQGLRLFRKRHWGSLVGQAGRHMQEATIIATISAIPCNLFRIISIRTAYHYYYCFSY